MTRYVSVDEIEPFNFFFPHNWPMKGTNPKQQHREINDEIFHSLYMYLTALKSQNLYYDRLLLVEE